MHRSTDDIMQGMWELTKEVHRSTPDDIKRAMRRMEKEVHSSTDGMMQSDEEDQRPKCWRRKWRKNRQVKAQRMDAESSRTG